MARESWGDYTIKRAVWETRRKTALRICFWSFKHCREAAMPLGILRKAQTPRLDIRLVSRVEFCVAKFLSPEKPGFRHFAPKMRPIFLKKIRNVKLL
jgi:hypothetical protein